MDRNKLNVLSLFDGMSCGRIALERAGIGIEKYISSEVDKYAMIVANKNYPKDEHFRIGDVRNIESHTLPRIDLLIGGSPCQSFSFAGNRIGMSTKCKVEIISLEQYLELKGSGFEFDGQSYLFWEYVRLLKDVKPKYFLLENVLMSKKWESVITDVLGVEPLMINSSLVSAQSRKRLYWTNITGVEQPVDRNIIMDDILEEKPKEDVILRPCEPKDYNSSSLCHHIANATDIRGNQQIKRVYSRYAKAPTLSTCQGGHREPKVLVDSNGEMSYRKLTPLECERLQTVPDNYTESVSNSQRYKMLGNGWTVDVVAHIFKGINNG